MAGFGPDCDIGIRLPATLGWDKGRRIDAPGPNGSRLVSAWLAGDFEVSTNSLLCQNTSRMVDLDNERPPGLVAVGTVAETGKLRVRSGAVIGFSDS